MRIRKALADALYKNFTLTSLSLSYNNLESEVGKALAADGLCKNSMLNLGDTNLGSEEGEALADALCKNPTLTFLDLKFNNIGFKLSPYLSNNPNFKINNKYY
ncbi:hypothetical protein C2G38_2195811 [Gigaspora rosea]|uniref:Uncharacterized protein n=1 Tax=Gigaspora rosea TaxID=44941 RepID=A0A397UYD8_9GLOM|nr:hypothetical protein C2G38_2195811 [Gigaspora rosea]